MAISIPYPEYQADLAQETIDKCCEMGARLAGEVGLTVRHDEFLESIRGKTGVRVDGDKVYFDRELLLTNIDSYRGKLHDRMRPTTDVNLDHWSISCDGFSMAVIDIESEEVRPATCQDLRDLIKLVNSFGMGGDYPVMPQDLPPLMRALACFKICWEASDSIRPYDYLHRDQIPFLYEMHQVMEKPFFLTLCVSQAMMIDEKDLNIFLDYYPKWKQGGRIGFHILDYPMLGITKPVSVTGSILMYIAEMFSIYTLLKTYDPELEVPVTVQGGLLTDLRHACWAWGHPRQHLMKFLNSRIAWGLASVKCDSYASAGTLLETSSSAIDEQAAMEKMGTGMMAALQGARSFSGLGSMCVDGSLQRRPVRHRRRDSRVYQGGCRGLQPPP